MSDLHGGGGLSQEMLLARERFSESAVTRKGRVLKFASILAL